MVAESAERAREHPGSDDTVLLVVEDQAATNIGRRAIERPEISTPDSPIPAGPDREDRRASGVVETSGRNANRASRADNCIAASERELTVGREGHVSRRGETMELAHRTEREVCGRPQSQTTDANCSDNPDIVTSVVKLQSTRDDRGEQVGPGGHPSAEVKVTGTAQRGSRVQDDLTAQCGGPNRVY